MIKNFSNLFLVFALFISSSIYAQKDSIRINVNLDNFADHFYTIKITIPDTKSEDILDIKIPEWTPGYYQILKFSDNVQNIKISNDKNENLGYVKIDNNTWRLATNHSQTITLDHQVIAKEEFIA